MTYRQIKERLNAISDTDPRLDDDVSIVLLEQGESIPVIDFVDQSWTSYSHDNGLAVGLDIVDGVLDENHLFFTISF